MVKNYYSLMFKKPSTFISLIVILAYAFFPLFIKNLFLATSPATFEPDKLPLLSANYWSYFFYPAVVPLIIPIYAIYSLFSRTIFNNESTIIRFDNYFTYFKTRFSFLISDTTLFTLYIHIILTIRYFVMGGTISSIKEIVSICLCIILNILGFLTFGLLFQMFEIVTKNVLIGFFTAYSFCVYDFFAERMGFVTTFVGRSLAIEPVKISPNIMNLLTMLLLLIILIAVTLEVILHKDFLSPMEEKNAA